MGESDRDRFYRWMQAGKQVGKDIMLESDGKTVLTVVAVQRVGVQYRVVIRETDLREFWFNDTFARDESHTFDSIEEAVRLIEEQTTVAISDLAPRKGQRWF